jgi:hypothetical protein
VHCSQRIECLAFFLVITVLTACNEGRNTGGEGASLELSDLVETEDSSESDPFDEMTDESGDDATVENDLVDLDSSEDTFEVTLDLAHEPGEDLGVDLREDPALTDPVTADVHGGGGGGAEDCPDPDDPWVWYASDDPMSCMLIDYDCGDESYFDNACGCGCLAMTPCGLDLSCTIPTEYCETVYPGMPGGSISYTCQTSPESCWESPSCECIIGAVGFGDCEEGINGSIIVSIYMP